MTLSDLHGQLVIQPLQAFSDGIFVQLQQLTIFPLTQCITWFLCDSIAELFEASRNPVSCLSAYV